MSQGEFINTFYEDNAGRIYNVRLQDTTLLLTDGTTANSPPAGPADQAITANATGSKRRNGVRCRQVAVKWTGTPPTGYLARETLYIPVMTQAAFNEYTTGTTMDYLGAACRVVGSSGEQIR